MTDHFPWEDIYEGNVFPTGIYEFQVEVIEDGYSAGDKRMPKGRFRCTAPDQFKGMSYFENFVCGTDENLADIVPGTFGSKALKMIFKAAQVPKSTSFEELLKNAEGNTLLIHLNRFTQTKGDYAGREENSVVGYYKIGEREIGMMDGGKAKGGGGPAKVTMPPKVKAPTAVKKETIVCTVCSKPIPLKEFGAHVASCTG